MDHSRRNKLLVAVRAAHAAAITALDELVTEALADTSSGNIRTLRLGERKVSVPSTWVPLLHDAAVTVGDAAKVVQRLTPEEDGAAAGSTSNVSVREEMTA